MSGLHGGLGPYCADDWCALHFYLIRTVKLIDRYLCIGTPPVQILDIVIVMKETQLLYLFFVVAHLFVVDSLC